jgi:acyl-CoA synthetase (AMP-forming)/AMP-acid ligase II
MLTSLIEQEIPSRVAIAVAGAAQAVTYERLAMQVRSLASSLSELGLGRGDRIALALPNGLEMIAAFLACATVGTAAPLNPAYKEDEFRFYLQDAEARALIVGAGDSPEARRAAGSETLIIEAAMDSDGGVTLSSSGRVGPVRSPEPPTADEPALILHTSGTTSRPKRVPLAHANLMASARNIARCYNLTAEDVSLCVMPLFHVHGLVASTLATLLTGGTIVVMPRFNPLSFWSTVRENGVTWYSAVPTIHRTLLARSKPGTRPAGAENLRFIRSCSASLPPQMMLDMEERLGAPVVEAYGMTEAAHQMTSNPLPPGVRKPGSVGRGTSVEVAIIDEFGRELEAGAVGEVSIKGPNVFSGYEANPEANAASFVNGWFRTGDQGFVDEEGYLRLVGRIKELINRGGEKISPSEIDEVLLSHPSVAQAVCFGIPDRSWGEEVAAAVVLKASATEAELIRHCKSSLSDYKCPKSIYIVESIPQTATGKIQRRHVSAQFSNQ